MFVVETTEVIKLGDFFKVLSQFIQLPVLLPVKMGLHEGSDLTHTHTQSESVSAKCVDNADNYQEERRIGTVRGEAGLLPLAHSVDS